jgi:hypothetical protein
MPSSDMHPAPRRDQNQKNCDCSLFSVPGSCLGVMVTIGSWLIGEGAWSRRAPVLL